MAAVGSSLVGGVKEVAAAGTAEQITPTALTFVAKAVIVQALETNEEAVVVGGKEVKAKKEAHGSSKINGILLEPKSTITFNIDDPTKIYVDSRKNKDGVSWVTMQA